MRRGSVNVHLCRFCDGVMEADSTAGAHAPTCERYDPHYKATTDDGSLTRIQVRSIRMEDRLMARLHDRMFFVVDVLW